MAILDLKEKIEPFRKNATGYVKQLLSADHVVMSDGTTLQKKMDSLNSALESAVKFIDYSIALDSNAYVAPFSYYANNFLPISDIEKYGIPISIVSIEPNGQPNPISIAPSTNGNYRYTIAATREKVFVTVAYLKL